MKWFLVVLGVCAMLAASAGAVPSYLGDMAWSRGAPGSTWQEWTFDDSDNPAAPENSNNPYGSPLAYISGDGLAHWGSYDGHSGIWHAGSESNDLLHVSLDIPNHEELNKYKEVWLEVVYRVEAENVGIAPYFAATNPPDVEIELLGMTVTEETPGNPTTWRTGVFHWRLSPNPFNELICLDFSGTGGIIDSVTVDTICAIPVPGAMALAGIGVGLLGWIRRRTL